MTYVAKERKRKIYAYFFTFLNILCVRLITICNIETTFADYTLLKKVSGRNEFWKYRLNSYHIQVHRIANTLVSYIIHWF